MNECTSKFSVQHSLYYSIGNNDQLIKEELAIRNRIVGYDTVTHTFWTRNNEVLLR